MIPFPEPLSPKLWSLLAILARVGGFAALVPLLTTQSGAVKYRLALAIVLALLVLPTATAPSSTPADRGPEALELVMSELTAGLVFGFALRAVFMGIALAAQLVEQQLGLPSAGEESDETPATPIGRVYQLAALAMFFTLGGHRLVIEGLLELSAGNLFGGGNDLNALDGIVTLLAQACWLCVRVAAPAVLALLTANLATAMIARVLPQFPGSAIAQPAQLALGLLVILCSLSVVSSTFAEGFIRFMHLAAGPLVGEGG